MAYSGRLHHSPFSLLAGSVSAISNTVFWWLLYSCFLCLIINTDCDLTMVQASYPEVDDLFNELDRPSKSTTHLLLFTIRYVYIQYTRIYYFIICQLFNIWKQILQNIIEARLAQKRKRKENFMRTIAPGTCTPKLTVKFSISAISKPSLKTKSPLVCV